MGHFMSSVNPKAVADLLQPTPRPQPPIGSTVQYFPRPGELRPGRGKHAAIVTGSHEDGTLDLVVIFDFDDMIGMRHVPSRNPDGGMGWEVPAREALSAPDTSMIDRINEEVEKLRTMILGKLDLGPDESVLGILDEFEDRIAAVEKPKRAAPKAAKAKADTPKGK